VRRHGEEREVPVEELERGDRVLVRPGERISVDGTVVEGRSAVDQAPITGESMPVDKEPGAQVFAGSLNGDGALAVEVTRLAQESTLARVIRMVEEAQTKKSPTQRFAERFERIFVPASLGLVALMVAVPPLARLLPFREAFLRAMTVLVAASPCALAIATPSAVLAGIARGGRSGVLIKGGAELEALGRVRAVALDKTGTLTTGNPEVTALLPWGKHEEQELLAVCAAAEELSAHPLAQAVVRYARSRGLALPAAQGLHSVTGRGVRAVVAGAAVEVGNLRLFDPPPDLARQVAALEQAGNSTMLVRRNADYLGGIALADRPRREARTMVRQMRDLGVSSVLLLTGDNRLVARAVAAEVGVTEVEAELLPEDKVEAVRRAAARWGAVAMVGDGVNDAPAMAAAAVGIAMGAGGTAAALESADVALMADEVARIPFALALGRRAGGIICQNLFLSLGVIAALVPLALLGLAGIALAIALHEGSTLLVVGNALRLLGFSAHRPPPGRRS
jgi:Cd2+/Zn2+-exporting ATPase